MVQLSSLLVLLLVGFCHSWKNEYDKDLRFECPSNQYISNWRSKHDNDHEDRVWDFQCRSGFVSDECSWSDDANDWDEYMHFSCPTDTLLTGVQSRHDNSREDRIWKYKCCKITAKSKMCSVVVPVFTSIFSMEFTMKSKKVPCCKWTSEINNYDEAMDYTIATGTAIAGIRSVNDNSREDRRWELNVCDFTDCTARKITILDDIQPKATGKRIVGIASTQGCADSHKYDLHLGNTDSVTETTSITITKGKEFNFATEVSVEATGKVSFLGNGGELTVGLSQSFGGAFTSETSKGKETSTGRESSAEIEAYFDGPGATLIIGDVIEYTIDSSEVNVAVDVQCDDGSEFVDKRTMAFNSKTYGQTHFTTVIGNFNSADLCTRSTNDCIRSVSGERALNPYEVIDDFKRCFDGVGIAAK